MGKVIDLKTKRQEFCKNLKGTNQPDGSVVPHPDRDIEEYKIGPNGKIELIKPYDLCNLDLGLVKKVNEHYQEATEREEIVAHRKEKNKRQQRKRKITGMVKMGGALVGTIASLLAIYQSNVNTVSEKETQAIEKVFDKNEETNSGKTLKNYGLTQQDVNDINKIEQQIEGYKNLSNSERRQIGKQLNVTMLRVLKSKIAQATNVESSQITIGKKLPEYGANLMINDKIYGTSGEKDIDKTIINVIQSLHDDVQIVTDNYEEIGKKGIKCYTNALNEIKRFAILTVVKDENGNLETIFQDKEKQETQMSETMRNNLSYQTGQMVIEDDDNERS